MAVVKKQEFADKESYHHGDGNQDCFLCARTIAGAEKVVMWGGLFDLYLHTECAKHLGMHLIKDAILAEQGIRGYRE